MKRKVLVLTMGVICATQLWHSNHANALVTESVETNFVVKDSDNKKYFTNPYWNYYWGEIFNSRKESIK